MIINKALYNYNYSAFNLSILEYIDITNLSGIGGLLLYIKE